MNFQVGQVVILQSGGIKMTISRITEDSGDILCVWFDNEGVLHRDAFKGSCLKIVSLV